MDVWETLGVASGFGYVVLAGRNHWACWPVSLVGVVVYACINFNAGLYAESALQGFYGVLSVIGWMHWKSSSGNQADVVQWPIRTFITSGFWLLLCSFLVAVVLTQFTAAQLPWLDAPITVFSLYATWLTARRVLQHWVYWVVIDALSIWVYLNRGLPLTAALYATYCLLACWGWWKWKGMLHARS